MKRAVLFAPTLTSRGGLSALAYQLSRCEAAFECAIVNESLRRAAFPPILHGARKVYVRSHYEGWCALSDVRSGVRHHSVIAVQNPVLTPYTVASSLIQNHLAARPLASLATDVSLRWVCYMIPITALTNLQVLRSREVVVLNSVYPRWWRWVSNVMVRPNVLPEDHLRVSASQPRRRAIVIVTTWDRFRRVDVAVEAIERAGMGDRGWIVEVHAPRSRSRFESECKNRWSDRPYVNVIDDSTTTQTSLATSAAALFPSAIEGSSIAFLEAVALGSDILATDAAHFRESVRLAPCESERIRWVKGRTVNAWVKELIDWESTYLREES